MKVIIIGNGIAGSNAARYIRKMGDHEIFMVSSESQYPFSRTALMYIYMGHVPFAGTKLYEDFFWEKNRISLVKKWVSKINYLEKSVVFEDGSTLPYDKLIIATGSKPNKFGWPGQDLKGVQGLYSLQDLESMEQASQAGVNHAVIVGGGLIGVEMAEMFHSRNIPVTFLVREKKFWDVVLPAEEAQMVSEHILKHGIDLRLESEISEIIDDGNGSVAGVVTKSGEHIKCNFVGLTVGVSPNVQFLKESGIEINKGILVDEFLKTNIPDVFAIGDCAEIRKPAVGRKPIEAVWYTGRMMGQFVAQTVCGKAKAYDPGLWFNSAKFFDIEYQVYGEILATRPEQTQTFYWQHPELEKSIRIDFKKDTKKVIGFNLMGIRFRQEVCHHWIKNGTTINEVMQNLALANFDPEFYEEYEEQIVNTYNKEYGEQVKHQGKRKLSLVNRLLSKI